MPPLIASKNAHQYQNRTEVSKWETKEGLSVLQFRTPTSALSHTADSGLRFYQIYNNFHEIYSVVFSRNN